jgi:hypothetical protein
VTDLDRGRLFVSHGEWLNATSVSDMAQLRAALASRTGVASAGS